jgi:uncharacterized iron-regulated membrane protein
MNAPNQDPRPAGGVYQAFWRWHFYAGLLVLPVLMLMALTGGVYLFKSELNEVLYRPLLNVPVRAASAAPGDWVATVEQATGGRVTRLTLPDRPGRSVELEVERPGREGLSAYVDPATARLVGTTPEGGVMQTIKRLHSLDLFGKAAKLLVEIVAGWSIVLVFTGAFLWWPRGQAGGVVSVRGGPKRRLFWRDLHAVTGAFAGVVIAFLAVTGMPWSGFWGEQVRKLTNEAGLGRPRPPAAQPMEHHHHEGMAIPMAPSGSVPWALQMTDMPGMSGAQLPIDQIIASTDASGLPRPYVLTRPREPGRAWTAAYMPDKVEATRTVYLDPVSGQVLADVGYRRFGPAAKVIEWGIAVHQGLQFGLVNKLVMLAGCIAIWLLGISAAVMWWKRRPQGRLAAPPRPAGRGAFLGLLAIVLPLAIFYPLVGASLVTVLALDLILRRLAPAFFLKIGA